MDAPTGLTEVEQRGIRDFMTLTEFQVVLRNQASLMVGVMIQYHPAKTKNEQKFREFPPEKEKKSDMATTPILTKQLEWWQSLRNYY